MYYYQRLRDLREDADKTQKEIAELLNTISHNIRNMKAEKENYRFIML